MKFNSRFKSSIYLNGNYLVKHSSYSNAFYGLSKRALRIGEELRSEFPDSIDLKISNRCSHECPFCHESSTKEGKVLNLNKTKEILSQLPIKPIEIAVGGGNVLECLYETEDILDWLSERGYKTRITITLGDLMSTGDSALDDRISRLLIDKVEGIGVSISSLSGIKLKKTSEDYFKSSLLYHTDLGKNLGCYGPQVVYHVIAGITPINDIKWIIENTKGSVLVLGYKQWGRALKNKLPDFTDLKHYLKNLIKSTTIDFNSLGFDNLAIEQLGIKEMIDKDKWGKIYLGEEGTCSMYIDAVNGEFARTSRSPERVSWNNVKLLDYYASLSN